ncbi:hypothetical protein SEMRO_57_G033500.1 [Seminavis robusta]|uniref:Uncharacterized protein n=1 Tax=Seminavis robusta TaxID=568900 RepID=A0A9N8DCC1_9STRA|nr:hypothetical protein SEMRO_57_G033500.1 [Seminavis robusta]|eukprot:Sro57_g033500.1 n/a (535) ;mRNA; r:122836-124841
MTQGSSKLQSKRPNATGAEMEPPAPAYSTNLLAPNRGDIPFNSEDSLTEIENDPSLVASMPSPPFDASGARTTAASLQETVGDEAKANDSFRSGRSSLLDLFLSDESEATDRDDMSLSSSIQDVEANSNPEGHQSSGHWTSCDEEDVRASEGTDDYNDLACKHDDKGELAHDGQDDDGHSDSEDQESATFCDSDAAKEEAIRDGFLGFLCGYLQNDFFQKAMDWLTKLWEYFTKKIGRSSGDDGAQGTEDVAGELLDFADAGAQSALKQSVQSGGFGGGGGGAPIPMPPPGVAEMAVSAANTASVSTASGAAAAGAAGATAGSIGGMTSAVVSAVTGTAVLSQAGTALGVSVVAITAAAVSTGVTLSQTSNSATAPIPSLIDSFTPPVCSAESVSKIGYVELQIKALPPIVLEEQKDRMEYLFRNLYNEITGMCLDPYNRVLQQSKVYKWETDWGIANFTDTSNATREAYEQALANSITTTYWEAVVDCNGCPDHEPLFEVGGQNSNDASLQWYQTSGGGVRYNKASGPCWWGE